MLMLMLKVMLKVNTTTANVKVNDYDGIDIFYTTTFISFGFTKKSSGSYWIDPN